MERYTNTEIGMNVIKVNLPRTEKDYINGNGEGVFCYVSDSVLKAYSKDEYGLICTGHLLNDSIYYPDLKIGDMVTFELRGKNRPVVTWARLENKKALSAEEIADFIKSIMNRGD